MFDRVTVSLTDEEKRKFIKIGYKRIKQLEAAQAAEPAQPRLPPERPVQVPDRGDGGGRTPPPHTAGDLGLELRTVL